MENDTTISEDFGRRPKISEDVPINSEVLKKTIMLHTDLQNQRFRGSWSENKVFNLQARDSGLMHLSSASPRGGGDRGLMWGNMGTLSTNWSPSGGGNVGT